MKLCKSCNKIKPFEGFGYTKGKCRRGACKTCRSIGARLWRRENEERERARVRRHYIKNKHKMQARTAEWNKKHPRPRMAHILVMNQLKSKKLIKGPCEICGSSSKVEAHHNDYAKPLDIIWLCKPHHDAWHRVFEAENL